MRVLLIEDDSATAQSIELMLKSEGFNVYTTDLGEEGVDLGKIYDYDLILLDLGLPDVEGLEAVRRAHAAAPRVPLVVLTGQDDEALALKALQEGAEDYLVKGKIDTRSLLRALRYAIERKVLEEALALSATERARSSGQGLAWAIPK